MLFDIAMTQGFEKQIKMNRAVQTVSQAQAGIGLLMQQDLNADGEPDRADGRVQISKQ